LKLQNARSRSGCFAASALTQSFSARTFAYSSSTVRYQIPRVEPARAGRDHLDERGAEDVLMMIGRGRSADGASAHA
jgi:hypothetical protein